MILLYDYTGLLLTILLPQRPLKTGSPGCGSLRNDGTSSKPYCKGRDVAEDSQGGACVECVVVRDVRHVTIFCR